MNEKSVIKIDEAPKAKEDDGNLLAREQEMRARVYGFRYCERCNSALPTPTTPCQKCAIDREVARNSFSMVAMGALIRAETPRTPEGRKALMDEAFEYGELGAKMTFDTAKNNKNLY